jgi:leucyl aminopeptidase
MKSEIKIKAVRLPYELVNCIFVARENDDLASLGFTENEITFIQAQRKDEKRCIALQELNNIRAVYFPDSTKSSAVNKEKARIEAAGLCTKINASKIKSITVVANGLDDIGLSIAEGLALANYQFLKYFTDASKKRHSLESIDFAGECDASQLTALESVILGTYRARDLVNEPPIFLTATEYAQQIKMLGKEAGYKTEIFEKAKIQSLKMGGLLAVNKGSQDPPTFIIMEHKPSGAVNKKPIILVGKGVVMDTGGLSLKPTPSSMDYMKSDMAGSAAVVGALYAIARADLPINVIGLIPATDNRPGENAIVPGDVISMFNGMTVEVLNTDAEGRLILADALAYAQKYKPELVIDLATLTGAAARAIGDQALVSMGTAPEAVHAELEICGYETYERLARFPFWDEYGEQIKSDIADIKNLGGPEAGMITAGKFLEHFTKNAKKEQVYPWIHFDIAGVAFTHSNKNYRGNGGTGVGVRLLFEFLRRRTTV